MGRLTPEDAESTAEMIEALFTELNTLRDMADDTLDPSPPRVNEAAVRVALLNLMDVATEQDLKGTALTELPDPGVPAEDWEWVPTTELVKAINVGMQALVRDMATLRQAVAATSWGRELDVPRLRMAWNALADRQITGKGATLRVTDGEDGEVDLKVLFEPPMSNPFRPEVTDDELTPAQIVTGNMMSYAFTKRNSE